MPRYMNAGTPVLEFGYDSHRQMPFPSYFFTFAERLRLPYWLVIEKGSYGGPMVVDVSEILRMTTTIIKEYGLAAWGHS